MSEPLEPHIRVLPAPADVARAAADLIVASARQAIDERGVFTLALSGGSTPKALHQLLASDEYRGKVDWTNVELFFGDERCVAPDHELSNYRMAKETLFDPLRIPPDNVYRMRGEIDPQEAAKLYGLQLRDIFADGAPDLILLGMGPDGHTASLFPRTTALDELEHRCVANHVPYDYIPKGTEWRITMTAPFINRAAHVAVLCTGKDKAARVQEVLEGPRKPKDLPIQMIRPTRGQLTWMLDVSAAAMEAE
jgi:6-phosphogluconolactonase